MLEKFANLVRNVSTSINSKMLKILIVGMCLYGLGYGIGKFVFIFFTKKEDDYNEKNDNNSFINYFWCCFRKYRRINYWFHIF